MKNKRSYVYRVDHRSTGEFYIGFRSANKVPPAQDLGIKYFTSSKLVKHRFNEFTATIIAEFVDPDAAYEFEQELIFNAWGTAGLLNRYHSHGKGAFNTAGRSHSDETRRKLSEARKARPPISDETRMKMSEANTGRIVTDETRRKMSEARKARMRASIWSVIVV